MSPGGTETYGDHVLRSVLAPWRRSLWWDLTHVTTGVVVGTASFTAVVTIAATALGLLITFPLAIPVVWALFLAARAIGHLERSRASALLGVEIADPVRPLAPGSWWAHWKARFRDGARWRELAHGLLLLPLGLLGLVAVVVVWGGSAALATLPLYAGALPGGTAKFWLFDLAPGAGAFGLALVGVAGLVVVAPWVTVWLARLDAAEARWLLGPRERARLEQRVTELETSREAAVDSAEAERRRIERDLHDGAQQRLVALAVTLGEARQQLDADPDSDAGRELVARSHDEAKAALQEIRDLVRGIHPVILEDRGLDAALSAVVARSPVPVQVDVTLAERLPATVESAAYFVVSEALVNVARHAQAHRAWVTVAKVSDRLLVEVRDDGRGGADEARGTGIAGLRSRVASLGGWMHVTSPPGGPTTLIVELPCAS
jgi:signal transduction histidine kinase